MGYLDGDSVTVDAVLTKKGRELLARGGALDITHFSATDTGVDYTLWNPDHPSGSAFYGEAIENLPSLEANVHAEYTLRNRLISLNQDTVALPALEIGGISNPDQLKHTFTDDEVDGVSISITLKGFAQPSGHLLVIVHNPNVVIPQGLTSSKTLSGMTRTFLEDTGIKRAVQYEVPLNQLDTVIKMIPDTSSTTTRRAMVTFVEQNTGTYVQLEVTNEVKKQVRRVVSAANTKG